MKVSVTDVITEVKSEGLYKEFRFTEVQSQSGLCKVLKYDKNLFHLEQVHS